MLCLNITYLYCIILQGNGGKGNGNPLQYSFLENPRDGGAWWAAIYGVVQSRTRLKWLSSSSSTREGSLWRLWGGQDHGDLHHARGWSDCAVLSMEERRQEHEPRVGRRTSGARSCRILRSQDEPLWLYRHSALLVLRLCNPKEWN